MPSSIEKRSFLAPEDAIFSASSAPRHTTDNPSAQCLELVSQSLEKSSMDKNSKKEKRSSQYQKGSTRRKDRWKKLLWVKQSYPDNYTDQDTFLEHLQRNPRLQPYDFWPLVADSTVIVQHVCSVIIFVVCFVGIFQEHVSPIGVVGWGSFATFLGWILWDSWTGEKEAVKIDEAYRGDGDPNCRQHRESNAKSFTRLSSVNQSLWDSRTTASTINLPSGLIGNSLHSFVTNTSPIGGNLATQSTSMLRHHHSVSMSSITPATSTPRESNTPLPKKTNHHLNQFSHQNSLRLSTAKSALLIYFTLLGLSPILKSLTRSTSSDSIWTMSFLLFTINIFFFDYGPSTPSSSTISNSVNASNRKNISASLSTNAALMASTVLASRLPSTGQVFSLTLFSIEVFGLFPVFRNGLRQRSWLGHIFLTALLVLGAGGGVGLILQTKKGLKSDAASSMTDQRFFPFKNFIFGMIFGVILTTLAMGFCSWWLIGLQKYKNEINGPWDPARPVIRRVWGDEYLS